MGTDEVERCRDVMPPAAYQSFQAQLPAASELRGRELVHRVFYAHVDSIMKPYEELISKDLETIELFRTIEDPATRERSVQVHGWWHEIIVSQAKCIGMEESEFGFLMAAGFAFDFDQSADLLSTIDGTTASTPSIMTTEELADHEQQAASMRSHVAVLHHFCIAYGLYNLPTQHCALAPDRETRRHYRRQATSGTAFDRGPLR